MNIFDENGNYKPKFKEDVTEEEKDLQESQESTEELEEAVDVKSIIDEVIDTNWSGSNDEQMKAIQLLKGLATSDDPMSNKFMKALDAATSKMKKEDFK